MKASSDNNHGYNKQLKTFARENRNSMTKAEACLWKYVLRAGGIRGFTFRRQRPVLQYIADFMCKELMLIIEVDGITHSYGEVSQNDMLRQKELETAGFEVIRFTDDEVLHHINAVYLDIDEKALEIMTRLGLSSPQRRASKGENPA